MKEIRYFYCPNISNSHALPGEEVEHAVKVLRLQTGDEIVLTDGKVKIYQAEISQISKKHCEFNVISEEHADSAWEGNIHIGVAPTKNINRIEWLVEKSTEIGIDRIDLLNCQYSERRNINLDRLEKIVISAMKQSHKAYKPYLGWNEHFTDFVTRPFDGKKFIAHCYNDEDIDGQQKKVYLPYCLNEIKHQNCLVLIGPEGDFSIQEVTLAINNGFQPVSLGPSRLRTETAALMAVAMMHLNNVKI